MAIDEQQIRQWISSYANKSPNVAKVDTALLDALLVHEDMLDAQLAQITDLYARLNALDARVDVLEGSEPEPPNGDFTWTPLQPVVGQPVTFTATSTTPNPVYNWEPLGLAGNPVTFAGYQGTGTKTVQLLVNGTVVATKSLEVVAAPTPPPPTGLDKYGISFGINIVNMTTAQRAQVITDVKNAGATLVRFQWWSSECDPAVQQCLDAGLDVALIVMFGSQPASAAQAEANARTVATRWPQVKAFIYWNEPDLQAAWTPASYADACVGHTRGIRAVAPGTLSIVGGLWKWKVGGTPGPQDSAEWVHQMYDRWQLNGVTESPFDAIDLHLYGRETWSSNTAASPYHMAFYNPPDATGRLRNVRAIMDAHGDTAKLIVAGECGDNLNSFPGTWTEAQKEAAQAAAVIDAINTVKAGRLASAQVYTAWDDAAGRFGIYSAPGVGRPSLAAYKAGVA